MASGGTGRPAAGEVDGSLAGYVALVPERDVTAAIETQLAGTVSFLRGIPAVLHGHRYAPGKWTVREVVGHVLDTERLLAFRAFAFARGETAPLPGADEDLYARNAPHASVPMDELVEELEHVRGASAALFRHLPDEAWARTGVANGRPVSVRALAYILLGHERHHWNVLRERYLGG